MRRLGSLTRALDDRTSPISTFLTSRFSPGIRDVQREFRERAPALRVAPLGANAGTIGTAFDWLLRYTVDERPDLGLAEEGACMAGPVLSATFAELKTMVEAGEIRSNNERAQLCWGLALFTEVFRAGGVFPGSPLSQLSRRADADDLLAIAPDEAVAELAELVRVAEESLLSAVKGRGSPVHVGPTFDGSELLNADADLIARGLLVELKTGIGGKRRDGSRFATLDGLDLYQVLGYVLLDFTDEFELDAIAMYAARYGYFLEWPMQELLDRLAARVVDVRAERAAFAGLLHDLVAG